MNATEESVANDADLYGYFLIEFSPSLPDFLIWIRSQKLTRQFTNCVAAIAGKKSPNFNQFKPRRPIVILAMVVPLRDTLLSVDGSFIIRLPDSPCQVARPEAVMQACDPNRRIVLILNSLARIRWALRRTLMHPMLITYRSHRVAWF
ncbi:hypothetical protein [Paraburkholderia antibiotica]|uniref:Uncharacterized protein n=1 Tax=Paraburkholderia antibiotica TaxID=2728839 RepID=A0A7Y0A340_9BURK|nr:hypothetical protein [Paraburkholderia antibiotica]NML35534.1 hypothetical protein [Paraburkholderia antibiotica]